MGLHDEEEKRKRGCVTAKWTAKCRELMETDPRFMMEFDKVKSGIKKTWGGKHYLLNIFQAVCSISGEIRVLSKIESTTRNDDSYNGKALHVKPASEIAIKRMQAWKENNYHCRSVE